MWIACGEGRGHRDLLQRLPPVLSPQRQCQPRGCTQAYFTQAWSPHSRSEWVVGDASGLEPTTRLPVMWRQTGYHIHCAVLSSLVTWGQSLRLSPKRVLGREALSWEPGIQQAPGEFYSRNCAQSPEPGRCSQQQFRAYLLDAAKLIINSINLKDTGRELSNWVTGGTFLPD